MTDGLSGINPEETIMHKIVPRAFTALLTCSALMAGQAALAAEPPRDYVNNCAVCHGMAGKGDGQLAANLTPKPTDLTQISKNNGGKFPYWRIRQSVDGRIAEGANIRGHGPKDMPVWGQVFYYDSHESETVAKARMLNVIDYIISIQSVQ